MTPALGPAFFPAFPDRCLNLSRGISHLAYSGLREEAFTTGRSERVQARHKRSRPKIITLRGLDPESDFDIFYHGDKAMNQAHRDLTVCSEGSAAVPGSRGDGGRQK
jgi:hypothetical protein